jgi:lysophospholipase L1-like esterase
MHVNSGRQAKIVKLTLLAGALLAVVVTVAALLLAGDAKAGLGRVVALGDSFASGPGLGAKTTGSPAICDRTVGGYPELLIGEVTHDAFVNETCSGATTSSLFHGSNTGGSWIRPQLDALDGSERVVLLTVGDNNAGFGDVVANCLFHNQSSQNVCKETYVSDGVNTLIAKGEAIAGDVGEAIDAVHTRSPGAKVFLVGYLDIAPPDAAGCSSAMWLTQTDGPIFDQWERAINDTLSTVAAKHGATFVDSYKASAEHTACAAPAQRWVNPYLGTVNGVPIHPNSAGSAAVAGLLLEAIKHAGLNPGPQADLSRIGFRRLRSTPRGAAIAFTRPPRGGHRIAVNLESAAAVELKLERIVKGRVSGGVCRTAAGRNGRGPACRRHTSTGAWQRIELQKGNTSLYLTGRARGRMLRPGWYRVRMRSDQLPVGRSASRSFMVLGRSRAAS